MILCLSSMKSIAQDQLKDMNSASLERWSDLKYGMFIHWGDFSSLGGIYGGEKYPRLGEQIQRHAQVPADEYEKSVAGFNPVDFDAEMWVNTAREAGMKYMVLTVKHHNGFCLWDTRTTSYDIIDATPFPRDPVKELADACEQAGLGFGVYYSIIDWHYPGSVEREAPGMFSVFETIPAAHQDYSVAQLRELCSGEYGQLLQIFFDMGLPTPEQSGEYRSVVKELLPGCQINGRVMNNKGDFLTMPDNAVPNAPIQQSWEAPGTLYHWSQDEIPGWSNEWWNTWGYKSWIPTPPLELQVGKQIRKMAVIVSRGGNFLLNVGPDGTGRIIDYEKKILREMGDWLKIYGDAIYASEPTPFTRNPELVCTRKPGKLYFFLDKDMEGKSLELPGMLSRIARAYLMSEPEETTLEFSQAEESKVLLPNQFHSRWMEVLVVEYEGDLEIETPVIHPDGHHNMWLPYHDAFITGSYDSESYKSLANDTHCNWNMAADRKGIYRIRIDLRSKHQTGDYILHVGDKTFPIQVTEHVASGIIGDMELQRSENLTVSVSPAEKKRMNQNGASEFNRLMLEDVNIFFILSK